MAALAFATDLHDLRARMGRIVLGYTKPAIPSPPSRSAPPGR